SQFEKPCRNRELTCHRTFRIAEASQAIVRDCGVNFTGSTLVVTAFDKPRFGFQSRRTQVFGERILVLGKATFRQKITAHKSLMAMH
ncbi:hypothetical protein, partial [Candidatus Caldatribacterium sp.]|uniref:hypothetical protein n=1 Tax=Candidatus Caldatribacterium sp. TaxID=2282143 RepID=UPI00384023C0|nr:hypothetical protein [Candidatus Caldatribacterium sp.]